MIAPTDLQSVGDRVTADCKSAGARADQCDKSEEVAEVRQLNDHEMIKRYRSCFVTTNAYLFELLTVSRFNENQQGFKMNECPLKVFVVSDIGVDTSICHVFTY